MTGVTVVVVTRDRPGMLAQALASVRQQTQPPAAVVVVDDGSVTPVAGATVRHARPAGVSAARNAGLAKVRTPLVAFLDDDDVWAPGKLAAQQAALTAAPGCRWCYVGAMATDAALQPIGAVRATHGGDVRRQVLAANMVSGGGSSVLAETTLVREVGGFDEAVTRFEDWDLWIRLALRSPVVALDRPLVGYRRHPGGRTAVDPRQAGADTLARYAAERTALGVTGTPDDPPQVRREALLAAGRRGAAARAHAVDAVRRRSPELALGAVFSLVAPEAFGRAKLRRWRARTPPEWFAAVADWLPPDPPT